MNKKKVIFLMGPTASGKTDLALQIAKHLPVEIISVDSALIYRGMDIGTGKPTVAEREAVKHHLIDICDPAENYSVGQFRTDALRLIDEIHQRKKTPLFVGGTMFYFKALKEGISDLPPADKAIRAKLDREREELGLDKMHERLKLIDPESAERIHPNDPQRLLRALEVYEITGKTLSYYFKKEKVEKKNSDLSNRYHLIEMAIAPNDRAILHQRIANRFEKMIEEGFVAEVKVLFDRRDLNLDNPSIRSVGYRQIWNYLEDDSEYDFDMIKERAVIATRQLAKRQLTWLRSWKDLTWFDSADSDLLKYVLKFISH